MSFTLTLSKFSENNLLDRKEYSFELTHTHSSIPKKDEVATKIASLNQTNVKNVVVKGIRGSFGSHTSTGHAKVYKTFEALERVEPDHVVLKRTGNKKVKKYGRKMKKVMRKKEAKSFGSVKRNANKQKKKEQKGN